MLADDVRMNPSLANSQAVATRAAVEGVRSGSSHEEELAEIRDELAAARELLATCDPDSPAWSAEAEVRRLELRLALLITDEPRRPPTGGASSHREGKRLLTAA